jgi:hypothetical protein
MFFVNRIAQPFLPLLVAVPPDQNQTLDDLDSVLYGIARETPEAALDFLSAWVLRHRPKAKLAKVFDMAFSGLRGKPVLQERMAAWLAGPKPLYRQAVDVIDAHDVDALAPSVVCALDEVHLGLLVWRITRGGRLDASTQAALLRSLLRAAPKSLPVALVEEELQHFVWNFPGSGGDVLLANRGKLPARTRAIADRVAERHERHRESRAAWRPLKELQGDPHRVKQFHRLHDRMMARVMDEAREQSLFFQLGVVTTSSVARGEGWINRVDGHFSEPARFGTFEHSMELPRGELIDPDGELMRKMELQVREQEVDP